MRLLIVLGLGLPLLMFSPPARAADIGVLSDGRQMEYLSILGDSSASARTLLTQDGHTFNVLPSLNPGLLDMVDIVWLPLLQTDQAYTLQERLYLYSHVLNGGRIIWIGDADLFNTGDDSFLATFGTLSLSKLSEANLTTAMSPTLVDHAAVTGPYGTVNVVGTNAQYGLFHSSDSIADAIIGINDQSEVGTYAGFMEPSINPGLAGRVAFICDTDFHGQLLEQDDHTAFLRNIVRWAEAAPGYTPSGTDIETGELDCTGDACQTVSLTLSTVSATGHTAIASIGAGRCGFTGVPQADLPDHFIGVGFEIETTAVLPSSVSVSMMIQYEPSILTELGVDEAALYLYWHDSAAGTCISLATTIDTSVDLVEATASDVGVFLLGNIIEATDCDSNGIPDACDLDPADPDGDGLVGDDCNENGIPDVCDVDPTDPDGSGTSSSDCNVNGVPDECDIDTDDPDGDGLISADCNSNAMPDECETGLAPTVSEQPISQFICIGESATFTVQAEGYGELTYQWRKYGADITDATESSYTIDSVTQDDAADYIVVITNDCGATTSGAATLTVLEGPEITDLPEAQTTCEGTAVEFTVNASGMGTLTYAWKLNGELLNESEIVSGTTTDTLRIEPVGIDHAGSYTCLVTDDCGESPTSAATLTVNALTQIGSNPEDVWTCPGSNITFEVVATGTNLAYRWQVNAGSGFVDLVEGGDYSGVTSAVLHVADASPVAVGLYRCIVTGDCGTPQTSTAASLTVGTVVAVQTHPSPAFSCIGEDTSFSVTAIGDNLAYRWQHNDGAGFYELADGGVFSGTNTPTLALSGVTLEQAGSYRCVVYGDCGPSVPSQAAALTVGTDVHLYQGPMDRVACPGASVFFQTSASGTNVHYQWQFDGGSGYVDLADGEDVSGALTNTITLSNITLDSVGDYRCALGGDCGDALETPAALLSLHPLTVLTLHPADETLCEGGSAAFTVSAEGLDLAYAWQFNDGVAWEMLDEGDHISGVACPTLSVTNVTANEIGLYRCMVTGGCGPAVLSDAVELTTTPGACDCNDNGLADSDDIASGVSTDCNVNGVPDECDIEGDPALDCNTNGILDACEIADGADDCNEDGVLDECQIEGHDCNEDGVLDACQLIDNDCNKNGIPDECDPPYIADAGEDRTACRDQASALLGGATVATGSNPPYAYLWRVVSGPAGGGSILSPTSERSRFLGTIEGEYEVELQVSDSTTPPCVITDFVTITVTHISVDAGDSFAMCADATSSAMSPVVSGGVPPYSYEWTLENGSTSMSPDQFTGSGAASASPMFTPDLPGQYILRVTVEDSNDPPCTATDTLTISAAMIELTMGGGFTMCVNTESAPLPFSLTGGGTALVTYIWSIEPGSPSTDPSQFGGAGRYAAKPTFRPTTLGTYGLRVTVTDSSVPPCEGSEVVYVTAVAMSVDAGVDATLCVGGSGIRLAPSVQGGFGNQSYLWAIESGPSLAPSQFTDSDATSPSPLFIPAARGSYTLRLTAVDSATPPCVATDIVIVRATSIDVEAGSALVTRAFQPSRELGAVPLAVGGSGLFDYEWEVVSGPNLSIAQFSNAHIEHPLFTPAAIGSYELRVTVIEAGGTGCEDSDTVVVEAFASELTLPINVEGRLYMPLRITAPLTGGVLRFSRGTPGVIMSARMYDEGSAANFTGLVVPPSLSRRLSVASAGAPGSFLLVVSMFCDDAEISNIDPSSLRLHWFNEADGRWHLASIGAMEAAATPNRVVQEDLGRQGVDTQSKCVWAVVDHLGVFSIGVPGEPEPTGTPIPPTGEPDEPEDTVVDPVAPFAFPFCGAMGVGEAGLLLPLLIGWMIRSGRGRGRSRRQTCRRLADEQD